MTATMNKEERRLYEMRPFKAYDAAGNAVYFRHLVDKRQAMETFGLTELPPGTPGQAAANPFKDYESKSSEAIRELCIARNVVGYMLLDKGQQIDALRELDKRDDAARDTGLAAKTPKKEK